jgi:hypothetical protein
MPRTFSKKNTEIVMVTDFTGVIDLRVFATHPKRRRPEIVGTASLRVQDLRDILPLLRERLLVEDYMRAAEAARGGRRPSRMPGNRFLQDGSRTPGRHQPHQPGRAGGKK